MIPNIAVIVTDANRKILWVNDDFTIITGYALREVYGHKPSLLQGPRSEIQSILRIRKALEEGVTVSEEITNYRKNGEIYTCKLIIHPIYNDQDTLTNFIAFEVDGDKVQDAEQIPLFNYNKKYQTSSLKGIEEMKLYARLKKIMSEEKIYLNPTLTLKEVADKLATNTKYLSQVVNNFVGINFQQYINTFRVNEAKIKIQSEKYNNLTLYGLALQCGFKNKSTFYKVFKHLTNQTPREYQLNQAQNSENQNLSA